MHLYQYLLYFLFFTLSFSATAQDYLKSTAKDGDGIYSLFNRYNISRSSCNLKKFYRLNQLSKKDYIKSGVRYKLPIQSYRFNNKSIRTSIGIKDWRTAKKIERYNDLVYEEGIKKSNFRKGKRELWVPYNLKACPSNLKHLVPTNRNFPVLGKKYASVPLKTKKLAGAVYYLVAGHGGPDPGAMTKYKGCDLCEDEYAYDITLRLARNLLSHGALVHIIVKDKNDGIRDKEILVCDTDETCLKKSIPRAQKARLTQRSDGINTLYKKYAKQGVDYQRMIEIHVDSRSKSKRLDLFFYHYPKSIAGKLLANKMHKTMKQKYARHRKNGAYYGTVTARDLHMLREVKPTPVFIEVANIQNPHDQKRILYPYNRQALADWMSESLLADY